MVRNRLLWAIHLPATVNASYEPSALRYDSDSGEVDVERCDPNFHHPTSHLRQLDPSSRLPTPGRWIPASNPRLPTPGGRISTSDIRKLGAGVEELILGHLLSHPLFCSSFCCLSPPASIFCTLLLFPLSGPSLLFPPSSSLPSLSSFFVLLRARRRTP